MMLNVFPKIGVANQPDFLVSFSACFSAFRLASVANCWFHPAQKLIMIYTYVYIYMCVYMSLCIHDYIIYIYISTYWCPPKDRPFTVAIVNGVCKVSWTVCAPIVFARLLSLLLVKGGVGLVCILCNWKYCAIHCNFLQPIKALYEPVERKTENTVNHGTKITWYNDHPSTIIL